MSRNPMKYLLWTLALLTLWSCDDPVDWRQTFDSSHDIPYGTRILRKELPKLFPESPIVNINRHAADFLLNEEYDYDAHYLFIDRYLRYDSASWETILDFVHEGGSAFIALDRSELVLENRLDVSVQEDKTTYPDLQLTKMMIKTPNEERTYIYEKGAGTAYFLNFNQERTEVLGYLELDGKKKPNFLKIQHGDGTVFLNTSPLAFTNYHMLKKDHFHYISQAFSYLDDAEILWDNHRIRARLTPNQEPSDGSLFSALDFIMKQKSLKWAFYLLCLMGVMYLLFNSKRKQRITPVILPYRNYTLDFSKTLAEVFRYKKDHGAMVRYKTHYFLDQLRSQYYLSASETIGDFSAILSAKSGVDINSCQQLVNNIQFFKNLDSPTKEDFFKLYNQIETFNQKSNRYGKSITRK